MKRLILISLVALGIIAVPQSVEAQGFLKKLSKGLESVNKGLDKAGDKASVATGQAVTQENGVFVMNPVSKAMNVEVVKAIGRSTSENFGDVELVLRVNVKEPVSSIALGGSWGQGNVAKCGDASGEITFKNVPIEWDPTEE